MNKKIITISIIALVVLIAMVYTASASGDIFIHPDTANITVGVYPNAVSPPLEAEFVGWGTAGFTTYMILVQREHDGYVPTDCMFSSYLTTDPQTVTLPNCKIPASDVGVAYKVYAQSKCPVGGCEGTSRSRWLEVDAPINPVPELNTLVITSAGLLGLLGLVRFSRKN